MHETFLTEGADKTQVVVFANYTKTNLTSLLINDRAPGNVMEPSEPILITPTTDE